METIVTDTSPKAMALANEVNLAALGVSLLAVPGVDVLSFGETQVFFTGIPFPLFNGATSIRLTERDADAAIEKAIAEAARRNVPMLWWLTPSSSPADLRERLVAHGFQLDEPAPGMGVDLESLAPEELPPDVTVERVVDAASIHTWAETLIAGFGMPGWLTEPTERVMGALGLGNNAPMQHYLARLDSKPIAAASVVYGGGAAGIYNVATLEEARGRGIGRAITLMPLLDARARGYRIGILQSSPMGTSVYRRLGFQHVCDVTMCVWAGQPAESEDDSAASAEATRS